MNALETALYSRLSGGTALTALLAGTTSVYNQAVPRGASYDCVVYGLVGGGDRNETPVRCKEVTYSVKAISDDSLKAAGVIDAQIDALLHEVTLTVAGWTNCQTVRDGDFAYVETTAEGRNYHHVGGTYRILLSE